MRPLPTMLLALAAAPLLVPAGASVAARSSRPKEIVVVGSKVKEVIREAGLRSNGDLVQALSDRVRELVVEAALRAEANHRRRLVFHDLDCWAEPSRDELIVRPRRIARLLARRGFVVDDAMMQAISDKVRLVLDDAIARTRGNKRSTVRPYDL